VAKKADHSPISVTSSRDQKQENAGSPQEALALHRPCRSAYGVVAVEVELAFLIRLAGQDANAFATDVGSAVSVSRTYRFGITALEAGKVTARTFVITHAVLTARREAIG
jgi:hypothetical protein